MRILFATRVSVRVVRTWNGVVYIVWRAWRWQGTIFRAPSWFDVAWFRLGNTRFLRIGPLTFGVGRD